MICQLNSVNEIRKKKTFGVGSGMVISFGKDLAMASKDLATQADLKRFHWKRECQEPGIKGRKQKLRGGSLRKWLPYLFQRLQI